MTALRVPRALVLALIAILLIPALWLSAGMISLSQSSLIKTPDTLSADQQSIRVPAGASFAQVADQLAHRNLIDNPLLLRVWARWQGYAEQLHVGEYALTQGLSATDLVANMANGQVIEHTFTIIEGWQVRELLAALRDNPHLRQTLDPNIDPDAVMSAIDRAGQPAEGQFLPETYHFPKGSSDVALLKRANRALENALEQAWQSRQADLPFDTPDQALIMASIIEKETALAAERRRISGVFARRLEQGMRLQTDPTVIYGLGDDFDGDLRRVDLRTDTPWNTYTRHGLPPTPIALAGVASIQAAVNPADGDSLYFVSRGDGSHVFSATLAAHNAAVRRYQLGITNE